MTINSTKDGIKSSLGAFANKNLANSALSLFETLGYKSSKRLSLKPNSPENFLTTFVGSHTFNKELALFAEWQSIDFIFQLTDEEINAALNSSKKIFSSEGVYNGAAINSYLFFALDLKNTSYSRTALANITRAINKLFPMPGLVLFRHGETLTLSIINRRLHKKDGSKDVLEKVTLIKDICFSNPHRAHIEILFDLSFSKLCEQNSVSNFVELQSAWKKVLDTKELNKRFYRDIANWYFWAIQNVYFPGAGIEADKRGLFRKNEKVREHNAKNLIRLLTRILFVWFIKERGLVPEELFNENYLKTELLKDFAPQRTTDFPVSNQGSAYYRAILQNLFFACLNQIVGKREFRKLNQHRNVTTLMRYETYFKDAAKFIALIESIVPFMNGGLFDCLDAPDPERSGQRGGDIIIYEDSFSDRPDNDLTVPDYIFFGKSTTVDLTEELGPDGENAEVKGLIEILKSYKFTIAENTPIEEDIALDPELLGQVFENLLASYNPETKITARKMTGSFYTPREIVDYMVNEALIVYLQNELTNNNLSKNCNQIRDLVNYASTLNTFSTNEIKVIIDAIDKSKIIDPACGSGAFPMGVLHKLVHILHKLDPNNKLWKERQIEKAQHIDDASLRDQLIEDIENAFKDNELDYGRKLFLIESCIYGVDIQPVAIQISKLRFFISLIVDQKIDKQKENFGVRPLPNLETKFVAANTLVLLNRPGGNKNLFDDKAVFALEEELRAIRHRLFTAKTPLTKRKLRDDDRRLRLAMAELLIKTGWGNETARQLAMWDPYDQNKTCSFFDPEWLFGVTNKFDIAIGNPPFIDSEMMVNCGQGLLREYITSKYDYAKGNWDIYIAFFERGLKLANILSYISPDKWLTKPFGKELRSNSLPFLSILFRSGRSVFESVGVDSIVTVFNQYKQHSSFLFQQPSADEIVSHMIPKHIIEDPYQLDVVFSSHLDLLLRLTSEYSTLFEAGFCCENACATSDAYKLKNILVDTKTPPSKHYKVINTGTIDKYCSRWGKKEMTYLKDKYLHPVVAVPDFTALFPNTYSAKAKKEKLIIKGLTLLDATLDLNGDYVPGKTTLIITSKEVNSLHFASIIINSKVAQFYISERYSAASYNGGTSFTKDMLNNLPVPACDSHIYNRITSFLKHSRFLELPAYDFFDQLANALVYELYFKQEFESKGIKILALIPELPPIVDGWDKSKLSEVIDKALEICTVRKDLMVCLSQINEIQEVKTIENYR